MMRKSPFFAMLPPLLLLSACAPAVMADYPSLARRPIEQSAVVVPPTPAAPEPPAMVSATLAEAIRALGGDADRGETAFRSALGEAQSLAAAARGDAAGGEAWAVAQRALSRLEAARGPTTLALAELDRLSVTEGDIAELAAQQARVAALVAAQDATVSALADGLAQ